MGPKKATSAPEAGITGYDIKDTKILAAAFVSSTGTDKYDYNLFASLTGFTEGTLKKFWPPIKKKVMEDHPTFSKHLTGSASAAAPTAKATASKKRKIADADADAELQPETASADEAHKTFEGKNNNASVKGKRTKKSKSQEVVKQEHSSDAGEGEFVYSQKVALWLESADGVADLA